nr:diguanylate cyclase [Pseudoalteromonas piscicida]
MATQLSQCVKNPHIASPICAHVSVSIGAVHIENHCSNELAELIKVADTALAAAQKQQSMVFIKAL